MTTIAGSGGGRREGSRRPTVSWSIRPPEHVGHPLPHLPAFLDWRLCNEALEMASLVAQREPVGQES
jgi:hypothetical protein